MEIFQKHIHSNHGLDITSTPRNPYTVALGQPLQVLATLVTVEDAPQEVLERVASEAMASAPRLVGVTWSKACR